jgi:hypothetical protein
MEFKLESDCGGVFSVSPKDCAVSDEAGGRIGTASEGAAATTTSDVTSSSLPLVAEVVDISRVLGDIFDEIYQSIDEPVV